MTEARGEASESMGGVIDLLARSTPLLLFTIIGFGYAIGSVRIGGFRLGIAAVLFIGLFLGAIDPERLVIPEYIHVLGLILFAYSVGLQSGPMFFNLFRVQWVRLTALAGGTTILAAAITLGATRLLGVDSAVASGLFCGSLTNTPALAAAIEVLRNTMAGSTLDPAAIRLRLDGPTVGYSVAYPFGVIGLILAMQVSTKIFRVDFGKERELASRVMGSGADFLTRELRVANPQLIGRSFGESMLTDLTGMVFTRIKKGRRIELVTPEVVLSEGDVLIGIGTDEAIRRAKLLVGPEVDAAVEKLSPEIEYRDLVVINRSIVGKRVGDLSSVVGHPVIVSRIRRGGVHITPHPGTTLEFGDQIRIVLQREDMERATQILGNPLRDITETDFLSFSLGLILGVLVGMIPLPFFGEREVRLGFAGGPLIVGLILGRLGRTGPIVWTMAANANLTMRQLGILLFLAGIGSRAGGSFVHTIAEQGLALLLVGAGITILSAAAIILIASRVLRYDMVSTYGILSGIHTQPAALAFANSHTGSESAGIAYSAVHPIALILKIILAQVLVGL